MLASRGGSRAGFGEGYLPQCTEAHVALFAVPNETENPFAGAVGSNDQIQTSTIAVASWLQKAGRTTGR